MILMLIITLLVMDSPCCCLHFETKDVIVIMICLVVAVPCMAVIVSGVLQVSFRARSDPISPG